MTFKKLRRVFITWNNYQEDFPDLADNTIDYDSIENYFQGLDHIDGYVIGFEVGETGTRHIQGIFFFKQQKTFNTLRDYFKKNHIERVINVDSSVKYCKKDGDYREFGNVRSQGQRTDIEDFKDAIIDGLDDLELLNEFPTQFMRFSNQINKIRQLTFNDYYRRNNRDLQVVFLGGESGSGKTSSIYKNFDIEDIYRVTNYKNPFDSYQNQRVLVLDEYNHQFEIPELLNYLDIYPLALPARYNDKWACYEIVFIISNYTYNDLFGNLFNKEWIKAVDRRVHDKFFLEDSEESRQELDLIIEKVKKIDNLAF